MSSTDKSGEGHVDAICAHLGGVRVPCESWKKDFELAFHKEEEQCIENNFRGLIKRLIQLVIQVRNKVSLNSWK